MKKGFTLLELMIVIIIVGILATLGFVQYTQIIEKGRRAEAAAVLGTIRTTAIVWNQESGHATTYPSNTDLSGTLSLPTTTCNTTFYFRYTIDSGTGTGTATRCSTGGKNPNVTEYTLTLATDGTKGSTPVGLW